jgi:hypothetical protein
MFFYTQLSLLVLHGYAICYPTRFSLAQNFPFHYNFLVPTLYFVGLGRLCHNARNRNFDKMEKKKIFYCKVTHLPR